MGKRELIREHYAEVATAVAQGAQGPAEGVCSACCGAGETRLYPQDVKDGLPVAALKASRGCGNPLGQVALEAGMTVLDLGSGGGIDCLIAAADVGPEGRVYGLDMTDEMLALANENKRVAGAGNVEFIKGFIEDIPLADCTADVVTSNCVINLSADKPRALREANRVLKEGGRFVVADIITLKPEFEGEAGITVARLLGCRAGALLRESYIDMMREAGFSEVEIRVFDVSGATYMRWRAAQQGQAAALSTYTDEQLEGAFASVFVEAVKGIVPINR